ncbi:MAG: DUF192 domain-containing protein [Alphaproteobacteria bacterium]|nr:DUF192 domain-containing protein [Alphaproteobacteria bacterium]
MAVCRSVIALALVVMTLAATARAESTLTELIIETRSGPARFWVEVAATPGERVLGLMFRSALAPDRGMIFDYGAVHPVAMWMKNTFIPLDIIFVGGDGLITNIVAHALPRSTRTMSSRGAVRAAIELSAGTAGRLGISPGDRVRHAIFATDAP